jgi:hypothetical protein
MAYEIEGKFNNSSMATTIVELMFHYNMFIIEDSFGDHKLPQISSQPKIDSLGDHH